MIDKNYSTGQDEASTSSTGILPSAAEQKLRHDSAALLDTAKSEFAHLKDEAATQAAAVAEEAKAEISKLADKAKGMADEQKQFLTGQFESVADAVQKVAGELEAQDATTAGYARTVADTVSRFTDTVKNKDVDELLGMAQNFGRSQPVAFMGAAALLGFAASRFLLASAHRNEPMRNQGMAQQPYDSQMANARPNPGFSAPSSMATFDRDDMEGRLS